MKKRRQLKREILGPIRNKLRVTKNYSSSKSFFFCFIKSAFLNFLSRPQSTAIYLKKNIQNNSFDCFLRWNPSSPKMPKKNNFLGQRDISRFSNCFFTLNPGLIASFKEPKQQLVIKADYAIEKTSGFFCRLKSCLSK